MEKILVAGGGGFVGSHLARYLKHQGDFVRIADVKFDEYLQDKYYTEKLKIDQIIWENCIRATKGMDKVYNLAANMGGYDRPINIGSERLVSINELADLIIRISGNFSAPQGVRGRNADITLARRVLGWEPEISLEEGLSRTYKWIEKMVNKHSE